MKTHTLFATLVLGVAILYAQNNQPADAQAKGKMGKMSQMADHMSEMKGGHREVAQLADKLAQSFAAIQAEKDPSALAKKLTEHGALLKELQTKAQTHSAMMEKMQKGEADPTPAAPAEHKH